MGPGKLLCIPLYTWWSEPLFQMWPFCRLQKKVSFVNLMASIIQTAYFQSSEMDLCASGNKRAVLSSCICFFLFCTFLSPTILYQELLIIKTIKWILTGDREMSWHQQFSNGLESLFMWSLPIWIQPTPAGTANFYHVLTGCQPIGNELSPSPVPTRSVNVRNTTTAGNCLPLSLASLEERLKSEQAASYSPISGDNIWDTLASGAVRKNLIQALLVLNLLCVEACFC